MQYFVNNLIQKLPDKL